MHTLNTNKHQLISQILLRNNFDSQSCHIKNCLSDKYNQILLRLSNLPKNFLPGQNGNLSPKHEHVQFQWQKIFISRVSEISRIEFRNITLEFWLYFILNSYKSLVEQEHLGNLNEAVNAHFNGNGNMSVSTLFHITVHYSSENYITTFCILTSDVVFLFICTQTSRGSSYLYS